MATDVSAAAEDEIIDLQTGELGQPQPGLDGEQEERVVSAAEARCSVWRGEERVDLGGGEECDEVTLEALLRDGEDTLDEASVSGLAGGGEAEERVDGREASVAGAHGVAAVLLEMVEERPDERCIDVREQQ
jgi:hypothetical protein